MKVKYLPQRYSRTGQEIMMRELEEGEILWCAFTARFHKRDGKYFYSSAEGKIWINDFKLSGWNVIRVLASDTAYTLKGFIQ